MADKIEPCDEEAEAGEGEKIDLLAPKSESESTKPVYNDNEQNEEVEVEELAAGKEADVFHQFRISPGESRHEIC